LLRVPRGGYLAGGHEGFSFLPGIDHRADHALRAGVEHLADDAGLVPRHAHHRCHRVRLHRLKALHHRQVVLDAVLQIDGDAVKAALRHHLGREARRDRQPAVDDGFALIPDGLDLVRHFLPRSLQLAADVASPSHCLGRKSNGPATFTPPPDARPDC
jgi:hypothetical protein